MAAQISVREAAEIMGKCPQFVRVGLQRGLLPFGTAVKVKNRYNYYISPELFRKYVGESEVNAAQHEKNQSEKLPG